ncbi:MAG: formamidopyrimidine-DNA glycosylase [Armatimonadetes bacterium]|nr:formamidopyrimidine-DNA glycosylase [Armatimonadota bacterium]
MPELPDVMVYVRALRQRAVEQSLTELRVWNPFVLRTVDPPVSALKGQTVLDVRRLGKRIAVGFEDDLWLVIHLMIAGRLRWFEPGKGPKGKPPKIFHASLQFETGMLVLTEASSHKRASIHVVRGEDALAAHDPGGIEPLECSLESFRQQILSENRTLKRALTNPRAFSGIGNAYSDEILHAARLSPLRLTRSLAAEEVERLWSQTRRTLSDWSEKLWTEFGGRFPGPGEITAFRPDFAAHGKFGMPCPVCGSPIQRIRYAENETNYCANCQNEGRLLADRALSRLLKSDWPKTLEEMEGG